MSKKSQHNNILLAVIGFTAVVILVGIIAFLIFHTVRIGRAQKSTIAPQWSTASLIGKPLKMFIW